MKGKQFKTDDLHALEDGWFMYEWMDHHLDLVILERWMFQSWLLSLVDTVDYVSIWALSDPSPDAM